MSSNATYQKLLHPAPIPPEDYCDCAQIKAIYLAFDLIENPLRCDTCRSVIAPERSALTPPQIDALVDWTTTFGSIYKLWLQSGSYETWAYDQLVDPNSPVNLQGMTVAGLLSEGQPCGYLWFWSEHRPTSCPRCASALEPQPNHFLLCSNCRIYV
jgi:predicted Zn-ribbon and HTH transcriptional regulator